MKNLRQEFADTVLDIGQKDERLIVMVGDISHGILQPYAKNALIGTLILVFVSHQQ